jgi:exodeoxyribonuclease VII small subunit
MPAKSFEERLERLEALSEKLRDGKLPLDEAVSVFEEGVKLTKALEKDLNRAERKVEILTREPDDGETVPPMSLFPELSEEEKQ